jgi:SAM-dependent methyltransferase
MPMNKSRSMNPHWSEWRNANYDFYAQELPSLPAHLELVDLGAGPVQFRELFMRFKYTGVDFTAFPDVSIVTDLTKGVPLNDASADIVTLSNTLEHIPDPLPLLKESRRIVRDGGYIFGTVPFLVQEHQEPYDFNRYTHFQLERLLAEAGFTDIRVVPLGRLIDTYNTMELKFFGHAQKLGAFWRPILTVIQLWRRAEMRLIRKLITTPSIPKYTEGYGFAARA